MCQSKAQGGRRCAAHSKAVRAYRTLIGHANSLDDAQTKAVYDRALSRVRRDTPDTPPTPEAWRAHIDSTILALAADSSLDAVAYEETAWALYNARHDIPDGRRFAALQDIQDRGLKAHRAIRRQVAVAAAMGACDEHTAWERFHAFRAQYADEYAQLPSDQRPAPDPDWIIGVTTRDTMSMSIPDDPATLWAFYRLQADPDALPRNPDYRIASIDIETSGPAGKEGMLPENGHIIEVGIVEVDYDGNVTDSYEQLIRPPQHHLDAHGTGAQDIHRISVEDLTGQPAWEQVAPEISRRLSNRVMLAQNARFERTWLDHHINTTGASTEAEFNTYGPSIDSMCVAGQHFPHLPNRRLQTICEHVGVPYTNGHRALHDGKVAVQAYLAMRKTIHQRWAESPQRQGLTAPPVRLSRLVGVPGQPPPTDAWTMPA